MKKEYTTPSFQELTVAAEDILSLSSEEAAASLNDGPSVSFGDFE